MTSSEVIKTDTTGAGVKATVKTATGEQILEADILLSAVGIQSNIENIGLEANNIKTEKGRIIVDKNGQTSVPGIFAIGDCSPGQALSHVAGKEGINAAEQIAYLEKKSTHQPEAMDYNNIPGCTYCSPEVASVGFTEKAAKEAAEKQKKTDDEEQAKRKLLQREQLKFDKAKKNLTTRKMMTKPEKPLKTSKTLNKQRLI